MTQKRDGKNNPADIKLVEPPNDYSWREAVPNIIAALFLMGSIVAGILLAIVY